MVQIMSSTKVFQRVAGLRPGMSVFDLSYTKLLTCDMGQLIPVMCDEVVPGDIFKIGNQSVIRMQPLVAPVLHEINAYVHYFFVPYRLLWDDWEDFITGGEDGNNVSVLPKWVPTVAPPIGSLWDYFGFNTGFVPTNTSAPISFPRDAYNLVWNEYYRDENLQAERLLDTATIAVRNWEKDYFTASQPWQQRGTAPALPISGTTKAIWPAASTADTLFALQGDLNAGSPPVWRPRDGNTRALLEANTVDLSTASTFNVSDLRLAFQIQKWMERNARAGARYTESLQAHFGVSPRDERLQRPEYIGGSKSPVIVSEVLQTSSTDATSPQGNMAGHGVSASATYCGKYRATEHGLIIGLMSIMPRTMYQQGHDRQWLRRSRYDFYFPEFANLSEQAVLTCELYASGTESENKSIFGYQGRYDEMRTKRNMVCGQMRGVFDYWHLGRIFTSKPALNSSFITCIPDKRIFAAPSEPGFIVQFANLIKAWRPMPIQSDPGLIDHN
nr:MAG: major capsid protein [Microvirus sp.]